MRLVFFVLLCIGTVTGLIEPIPLPSSLEDCINYKVDLNKGSGVPLHVIQNLCLGKFISFETPHTWARNLTQEEQSYVKSLLRKIISETETPVHTRYRSRRNAFPKRVRREIRAAPFNQWNDYANAVRRLKFKEIGPSGRNRYDTLADVHMTAINSSHYGPNFLPWHRLYLLMFETALGVPIPYWDSTIDFELDHPTESIIWSSKYFGNGFGKVKNGPFANFRTPAGPLIRNIGSDGSLFNKRDLNLIFTKSHLKKISEPTAEERVSLEGHHNSVHNWVDGQMNTQEFSPHDPLFWTHHSFVDYLWENFRRNQFSRGVDPVVDNPEPPENVTFQRAKDPAVGLMGWYNSDGYSTRIANQVIYEPHPTCPKCGESPDMTCDFRKGVCVSVFRNPHEYAGNREDAQEIADRMIEAATGRRRRVFTEYTRDDRVRGDSLTMRKKMLAKKMRAMNNNKMNNMIHLGIDTKREDFFPTIPVIPNTNIHVPGDNRIIGFPSKPSVDIVYGPVQLESMVVYPGHNKPWFFRPPPLQPFSMKHTPFMPYINDMRARGDSMTRHYLRKRRSIHFPASKSSKAIQWKPLLENTFFLDGKTDAKLWTFVPVKVIYSNATASEKILLSEEDRPITDLKTILEDNSGLCPVSIHNPKRVFVQSNGLNYYGRYKDSIIYANKNSDISYIGIKRPSSKAVETFVSAYDSCGNTCITRCLVPGVYPSVYKSCSGAISVTSQKPLMYQDLYPTNHTSASIKGDNLIPVIFVCDV